MSLDLSGIGGMPSGDDGSAEAKQKEMEDARRGMLSQILTPEASERLNRVSIVKPEVGFRVGNQLIEMARAGRIRTKVEESMLIDMLEGISEKPKPKVTVQRRKNFAEDDEGEEEYDF